mmetsp:Transcript_12169/g.15948  ORF Transcript_12169/g.15948 Transcript_12169/m.15948 type:complete len:322 (-) Transcript_12169:236-1201(-)|eukprot:CAMPEP_0117738026 /NCGR_PEP_ID=MMETSP0947-20121206/2877_1 /TAXON_ID=44440 /ORGANISM="Chattonella subsalsa, Strain CCMP2191" /LENGTH=321 /DNA_ID=CAMNT_0005553623 /DNA_START=27 /DNA_END=992 /DNA_ORIENTATION=-
MITFYDDFFRTDIMNHCEFLKSLMDLEKQDSAFFISLLENLADEKKEGRQITPFYNGHCDNPKNPINIVEAYGAIKNLKGHDFNIYEFTYLDPEHPSNRFVSLFTFVFQFIILAVLVYQNISATVSRDPLVWILTLSTSFFFGTASRQQWKAADEFNTAFYDIGDKEKVFWLQLNTLSNKLLAVAIPIFNIYFVLLSSDANDAILNSLALFFILELDSMVLPPWEETRIRDEIAINAHDHIMIPLEDQMLKISKEGPANFLDTDKLYVRIEHKSNSIIVYKRVNACTYEQTVYHVSGVEATRFLELCESFECLINYKDIHD